MSERDIISEICNYHCVSCHKKDCPRGEWCKPTFNAGPLPPIGEDKECPLMQFEAIKFSGLKGRTMVNSRPITVDDTWDICESCKFSTVTEEEISLRDSFYSHCMDCPVHEMRDSIQECCAEAIGG